MDRPAARFAWALFDWAGQPYHTLVTAFIFAPYFVTQVVGDEVRGQELWGLVQGATAFAIALVAPAMGWLADRTGRAMAMIAGLSVLYVASCAALWGAVPGAVVVAALAVAGAGFAIELATVLTNAMLPRLAAPGRIGALSGTAWALGFVGGLVSLAITLALLAPAGEGPLTLAGLEPAFGLASVDGGPARATGPLAALWYALFVIPLFVLVPASVARGTGKAVGLRRAVAALAATPGLLRFLAARLAYQDGLLAIFAFGGIFGAGMLGWQTTELGLFGILLTVTGALGASAGGRLDDRFGAKPVIAVTIVMCLSALALIAALERPQAAADSLFGRPQDVIFLVAGTLVGVAAGPLQAASRSYLARRAPPGEMAAAFGLFAFSGKAVAFTGPLLVALATWVGGTITAGLIPIAALFVIGLAVLLGVPPDRPGGRSQP